MNYGEITTVTQSLPILIFLALAYFLPILIYLLVGMFTKNKKTGRRMITRANYWHFLWIWGFIQGTVLLLGVIFPIWAKLFN